MLITKGNLVTMADNGDFNILVHGCNCQNTMGSGIAKSLRDKWPLVYAADCKAAEQWKEPVARLGNFSTATVMTKSGNPLVIVNAYTQINYLPRGIDHFEYESFYIILKKLEVLASKGVKFGFPYIGTGLAGGDKNRIIPMIEKFSDTVAQKNATVTLVEYA